MDFALLISFTVGIFGLATAVIQYFTSKNEGQAVRQQIVTLTRFSEGLYESIKQLRENIDNGIYKDAENIRSGLESVEQSAKALFFSLVETKIGGAEEINDKNASKLDKKYQEYLETDLELKVEPQKASLKEQKKQPTSSPKKKPSKKTKKLKS